jgi:hypothetical protein
MDSGQQPVPTGLTSQEPVAGSARAARRWPPAEYLLFGLGLGSLLAAATVVATAPLLLAGVSIVLGEGVTGLGQLFWREWWVAGLAILGAASALLHTTWDGMQEDPPGYLVTYPRLRVAFVTAGLAAGAAGVAVHRIVWPLGPGDDSLRLFHATEVPSRLTVTAGLLAIVGCAAIVGWSLLRSSRLKRGWLAAGAPSRRAAWRPSRPPRRVLASLLGVVMAVLLVPAGWPAAGALRDQAIEHSRAHVVDTETFDPPLHDPAMLTGDPSGQFWTRQDLQRAIPAGELVIGLTVERTSQDRSWHAVVGLRPEDGAQLWRWSIRSRILDVVVDPVDRAVLVLLHSTVVVLDFAGEVRTIELLPTGEAARWYVVEQPEPRISFNNRPPHSPGLARTVVLVGYRGLGSRPTALLGVEVATGAVRWETEVPPHCSVHAVSIPESQQQPIGTDVLVSFDGGARCRTHDQLTRFGPEGPKWSIQLTLGAPALRSCFCRELWPQAIGPDLFTVVLEHLSDYHDSDEPSVEAELVLLDGDGHQLTTLPMDWTTGYTYLVEGVSTESDGPVVAVAHWHQWLLFNSAGDSIFLPVSGLHGIDPLATAWPLLVEHRDDNLLVVWDAGDGLRSITAITIPTDYGCWEAHLYAYGGQASLNCSDGYVTVVTLPSH